MGVDTYAEVWVGVPFDELVESEEVQQPGTRYNERTGAPYEVIETTTKWWINGQAVTDAETIRALSEDDHESALEIHFDQHVGRTDEEGRLHVGRLHYPEKEDEFVIGLCVGMEDSGSEDGGGWWGIMEDLDVAGALERVKPLLVAAGLNVTPRVFLLRSLNY